jgi:hypothetical protein
VGAAVQVVLVAAFADVAEAAGPRHVTTVGRLVMSPAIVKTLASKARIEQILTKREHSTDAASIVGRWATFRPTARNHLVTRHVTIADKRGTLRGIVQTLANNLWGSHLPFHVCFHETCSNNGFVA